MSRGPNNWFRTALIVAIYMAAILIGILLAVKAKGAAPPVVFTEADTSFTLDCTKGTVIYTAKHVLVVSATGCVTDFIFRSGFEK